MNKILLVLGITFIYNIQAADLTIPNTFTAGTPAVAADVNANFTAVESAVDDNNTNITTNASGIASNALNISNITSMPVGATPGDMLYWDGSVWQLTPAPPVTAWIKTPSLFLCNGVPTWSTSGCTVYSIGDTGPAGGIVFYVINGGHSGLEAARTDLFSSPWGCFGTSIPGAVGTAIGTGRQNTTAILAGCPEASIAARLVGDFTFGDFGDWFLPSRDELNELFLNRAVVGGFASNFYWSSSELGVNLAWFQFFDSGSQGSGSKASSVGVRAVRAF